MELKPETSEYRSGSALVMVLWIFVLLTVITAVVAQISRLDTKISAVTGDQLRCKWACRSGLETAIAILNDDKKDSDSLEDLWADNPEDLQNIELNGCTYSVEIIDEASKLNINTASAKQLMYLPDMTQEIANSILDWRDRNSKIRAGSAEAGYYLNLPNPYMIRNKAFRTIREVLRVKDVTEELFYGVDNTEDNRPESGILTGGNKTNYNEGWINYLTCYSMERTRDSEGSRKVNINSSDENQLARKLDIPKAYAKWIVKNRKKGFQSIGDLISNKSPNKAPKGIEKQKDAVPLDIKTVLKIAGKTTIADKPAFGKININTAGRTVLTAMLQGREDIAEEIIGYRKGTLFGITSFSELSNIPSLKKDVLKRVIDIITLRSDFYMIRSFASANLTDTKLHTEAVVDRVKTPVKIIYFIQGAKY